LGWNNTHDRQRLFRIIIKRIEVAKGLLRVQLDPAAAVAEHAEGLVCAPKTIEIPLNLANLGGVEIVTGKPSAAGSRRRNPALIRGVARGYLWRKQLLAGAFGSVIELARKVGVSPRYVIRMLRMGCLAPDIIEAILEGHQTAAVTVEVFRKRIPLEWAEQRLMLGFVE